MTPTHRLPLALDPHATPARRAPALAPAARRAPRRGRRAPDAFARARLEQEAADHARLVAAIARRGYELLAPVGHGGMGRVWLARAAGVGVVAIKAMLPKVADEPEFRAMFLDEGRIASRIASPHVAKVFALHEEDGVLFQVMEFVDGESLFDLHRAAQKRGESVPLGVVLRALADACDGLHAAHALCDDEGRPLQVVHRDVSPANVLVGAAGEVKLVDFGIAKARARVAESTLGFAMKGRVQYVAPEYALGQALDQRADTWSMGATLYFLLSGRTPYAASNEAASLFKLTSGEPVPPLPASVPADVRAIAERALARDPAARFATAALMRDALAAAAARYAPDPGAVARFVAEHESSEARERRQVAAEARVDPPPSSAPHALRAPILHLRDLAARLPPLRLPALSPRWLAFAVGAALASVVTASLVSAGDLPPARARAAAEPSLKVLADQPPDTLLLELPPTPPRAPRPPPARAVEPPPSTSPASPGRRHYGF